MRLENISSDFLKKEIRNRMEKHLDLKKYKVFIFGSRVTGKGDEHSDIDIGIEGDKPIPRVLFSNMRDEIEDIPILYTIEVVDFQRVPKEFRDIALQHIELLK
ncbi:nucleotidyltransferase domain-containing protein [Candidatus Peregrinibacteria bacterium]|nr:nucleotidyltransferase domain-containing protein [Candidatus Peregrinibacteria bacterium]